MRIFFAGNGCLDNGSAISYWRGHLVDALADLGHELVQSAIDWDPPLLSPGQADWMALRPQVSEQLLAEVRQAHRRQPIDLFFSYFYSIHVEPDAIRTIRSLGIPTVNFFCDAAHAYHLIAEISPAFDYCWATERQALPLYRQGGANPVHIQMGANPRQNYPVPGLERDIDVFFAGRLYCDRPQHLRHLIEQGIAVDIRTPDIPSSGDIEAAARQHGVGLQSRLRAAVDEIVKFGPQHLARRSYRAYRNWQDMPVALRAAKPGVFGPPLNDLVARSRIVLNFANTYAGSPGGPIRSYVKLRDFELPLCRAMYMPQYCDEIAEFYEDRKEVVTWRSSEELASLARYYLTHPAEAEVIREAGYRRALAEHTWQARYNQLFTAMGLTGSVLPQSAQASRQTV